MSVRRAAICSTARAHHQEIAQVGVAALGNSAQAHLSTGAPLSGHEAQPGGKLTPVGEFMGRAHTGHRGQGGDRPHTGDTHETHGGLAGSCLLRGTSCRGEAWPHPEETALAHGFAEQIAAHPGQSGVYPLVSGMEAFSIRAALAEKAEHTLDFQYFIVHEDATGQLLLYRVLLAARRGVRVRFLIDDLDAAGKEFSLATFSAHPNIEVRVFNPFSSRGQLGLSQLLEFIADPQRLNRRMHNKLWIADNAAAIVGGRNLGDEYFDAHGEVNCSDLDILAVGPVVSDISRSFDDYWNSEWAVPIEALAETPPGPKELAAFERDLETRLDSFRDTDYARALRETRFGSRLLSSQLPLVAARASALYDPPAKISRSGADEALLPPGF